MSTKSTLIESVKSVLKDHVVVTELDELNKYGAFPLEEFMRKLKEKWPAVEFAKDKGQRNQGKVWVYFPNETFCRGMIGWDDFFDEYYGEDPHRFGVFSQSISNNRYGDSHKLHYARMSAHLDIALSHAMRYLQPIGVVDLNKEYDHHTYVQKNAARTNLAAEFKKHLKDFGLQPTDSYDPADSEKLQTFMRVSKEAKLAFANSEADATWSDLVTKWDSYFRMYSDKDPMRFVMVQNEMMHIGCPYKDPYGNAEPAAGEWGFTIVDPKDVNETHENLQQKRNVAKLQVLKEGVFYPNVGIRIEEDVYCVY